MVQSNHDQKSNRLRHHWQGQRFHFLKRSRVKARSECFFKYTSMEESAALSAKRMK
jgi:hypothetical protein